ncbi:MAG: Smr/MutS family protein [Spirochaetales bacterium]
MSDGTADDNNFDDDAVELPITGELDLHLFNPKDAKDLVAEYLRECRAHGILDVRVVHGKGTGVLARTVQATLDKLDFVTDYHLDYAGRGSWGATVVHLQESSDS